MVKNLGLSDVESSAYLALLRLGGVQASVVAKDVGVKRTTIYDVLSSLTKKGFVIVFFKKSKRLFYAQKPQRVSDLYQKKIDAFTSIIPQLQSMEKKEIQTIGLRFIQTREELEQFYVGVLKDYSGKSYDVIGSAPSWEGVDKDFFEQFRRDRAKAKITTRLLLTADSRQTNPTATSLRREYRYLPKDQVFKSTIDIFPDQVLIVSPDLTALAVVIAVPVMVDVFKSIFELLWTFVGDSFSVKGHVD